MKGKILLLLAAMTWTLAVFSMPHAIAKEPVERFPEADTDIQAATATAQLEINLTPIQQPATFSGKVDFTGYVFIRRSNVRPGDPRRSGEKEDQRIVDTEIVTLNLNATQQVPGLGDMQIVGYSFCGTRSPGKFIARSKQRDLPAQGVFHLAPLFLLNTPPMCAPPQGPQLRMVPKKALPLVGTVRSVPSRDIFQTAKRTPIVTRDPVTGVLQKVGKITGFSLTLREPIPAPRRGGIDYLSTEAFMKVRRDNKTETIWLKGTTTVIRGDQTDLCADRILDIPTEILSMELVGTSDLIREQFPPPPGSMSPPTEISLSPIVLTTNPSVSSLGLMRQRSPGGDFFPATSAFSVSLLVHSPFGVIGSNSPSEPVQLTAQKDVTSETPSASKEAVYKGAPALGSFPINSPFEPVGRPPIAFVEDLTLILGAPQPTPTIPFGRSKFDILGKFGVQLDRPDLLNRLGLSGDQKRMLWELEGTMEIDIKDEPPLDMDDDCFLDVPAEITSLTLRGTFDPNPNPQATEDELTILITLGDKPSEGRIEQIRPENAFPLFGLVKRPRVAKSAFSVFVEIQITDASGNEVLHNDAPLPLSNALHVLTPHTPYFNAGGTHANLADSNGKHAGTLFAASLMRKPQP